MASWKKILLGDEKAVLLHVLVVEEVEKEVELVEADEAGTDDDKEGGGIDVDDVDEKEEEEDGGCDSGAATLVPLSVPFILMQTD